MSLENLRLEVLKLVYRHDRSPEETVALAKVYENYLTGAVLPQVDDGEQVSDKAQAPKRRKAAS